MLSHSIIIAAAATATPGAEVLGLIGVAVLTAGATLFGHRVAARSAARATAATREQTSGELALEIACEARAEVRTVKAELVTVRAESDQRHRQFGLAYGNASTLHHRWGEPARPAWPSELPPPTPTPPSL